MSRRARRISSTRHLRPRARERPSSGRRFLLADVERAFPPLRVRRRASDEDDQPLEVDALVAATHLDRRVRTVQRAVEGAVHPAVIVLRAAAVPSVIPTTAEERDLLAFGVLDAMRAAGHIDIQIGGPSPVIEPGPLATPRPGLRELTLDHPGASLAVGSRLVLSDQLDELGLLPPPFSAFCLAYGVCQAAASRTDGVDLSDLLRVLERAIGRHAAVVTTDLRRLVRLVVIQLLDLGWAELDGDPDDPLAGRLVGTNLGMLGVLMAMTQLRGETPQPLVELAEEHGYLSCDGGFISQQDLPYSPSRN